MIAWELPDGIVVKPVYDLSACAQPTGGFSIAGAKSPDRGPADVPGAVSPDPPVAPCVGPKLNGKTLRAAKRAIVRAGCRVGTVRCRRSSRRPGRVIAQSPRGGTNKVGGAKVSIVVARR